jgi:hypothetical protein
MIATATSTSAHTKVDAKAWASGPAISLCRRAGRCWSVASPPEPEPPCSRPAIELRLLTIAEARITDRIAVPIDAPDWRTMFSAVLVRAIAAGGTARIAAVMFGIIARPMPSPWMKLNEHSST